MSTYAGNPGLAAAVKDRVSSTFQQAVTLYKNGRSDEVIAGCTLILQMDPLFDPAKKLLEKTRNPASPINVDSLVGGASVDMLAEAREAMAARDFQRVVNITTEVLTNDLMNDEARTMGDAAREKMEAAPFVDQFARKCEQHLAAGNLSAAVSDLEKARSLDATHPALARIEKMIAAKQPAAAPAPAAATPFVAETPFVVDAPPASGRGAAPATDFGFTFEEDKGQQAAAPATPAAPPQPDLSKKMTFSGFSFDAPSAQSFSFDTPSTGGGFSFDSGASRSGAFADSAKAPAAGDFDFSTAAAETSDDDRKKIEQYLAEGDGAFDSSDYQQAIDLWSRIFLIDVTNEQASERIEKAKGKRRELEQKVEPLLSAAVQSFERKDYDTARVKFNDVLRADPKNPSALDYISRMPDATVGKAAAPAAAAATPPPPPESAAIPDIFADEPMGGGFEEPLVPPVPAAKAPAEKKAAAKAPAKKTGKGLPLVPIIAAVALLVVVAGGWFAWSKFSKPSYDPKATQEIFRQVEVLTKQHQYDEAISMLQDVKPEDPMHDKAVNMIADLQAKKSQGSDLIEGRPATAYYRDQIAAGQSAFNAHDYDGAKKSFEQAMRVKALPPDVRAMYDSASQQVAKLDGAKSLFRARQFQDALGNLDALMQQDPQNQNIKRMIIDAHFNLGATALQEERLDDAIKEFDEVLKLDPTDELAKRSKDLAARYNGQPKDLLYKIYVKYLPLRQVS